MPFAMRNTLECINIVGSPSIKSTAFIDPLCPTIEILCVWKTTIFLILLMIEAILVREDSNTGAHIHLD